MKLKFRLRSQKSNGKVEVWPLEQKNPRGRQKLFLFVTDTYDRAKIFFANLKKSYILMTKREKIGASVFLLIAMVLMGARSYRSYIVETVSAPDRGGAYTEAMVGEVKFLNPIVAKTDAEKSVTRLMFQGLVKVTGPNTVLPDAAESYEISSDGTKYTFHLKSDNQFSDGQPLTANDVAQTVAKIQDPSLKSPIFKTWSGVTTEIIDDKTIEFVLQKAYGPFIFDCDFGIIPAHLSPDDFSKSLVGSGPFKFIKSVTADGGKISQVDLVRNDAYSGDKPYLDSATILFLSNIHEAVNQFMTDTKTNAVFGAEPPSSAKLDYNSSRELALIFNLRKDALKDVAVRQKILSGGKFDQPLNLTLATLDAPRQHTRATDLAKKFAAENIKVKINYYDSAGFQDHIVKKDYDLILYGFDFGDDRDPYTYWHSSQINDLNLAGWSDKASDILMEDARMLPDAVARNVKYDEVFTAIQSGAIAEFYEPIRYKYYVKPQVKGIRSITGTQVYSRFDTIGKWYIDEKRVKK
ncbi:hypothetical protein COT78_03575 [Candidatus Berkelbacteria bacterium CG10_big_fil_rev_8_21_14_0_10_43_13]|uniref:Solute-binding protein family 5 domain-containing protein n=1 Tax=Candidatus Berkelbacteria bacterium CG10_big_fil_rev_8_21_14_0_10_43_13 TaxID=1974514 RepID=A0A2H0W5S1_9BACT|nr:MAG: hypothetical protein COT78_03575 [Candidatus Berkelbacteria bacterium CG10_big_fil_rev_8_21_14_0_10_43_13]